MFRRKAIRFAANVMAKTAILRALDRSNRQRGGVILVFHEISLEVLEGQLSHLAEIYNYVSLDEFTDRLIKGKSTVGLAAITFDDGLGAVTEAASSIATARHWPMTFYLPTRYLDTLEPYWFMELDQLLNGTNGKALFLDGRTFPLDHSAAIEKASRLLRDHFKTLLNEQEVHDVLKQMRLSLYGSEDRPTKVSTPAPISWHRVKELSAHDEVFFEAHSVSHLAVSCLSRERIVTELEDSRARIEEVTGRPVRHFCYPYGSPREVGKVAPDIVRKLFRSGTTTDRGRCSASSDLALLPRVPLDEGDSEEVVALKVGVAR